MPCRTLMGNARVYHKVGGCQGCWKLPLWCFLWKEKVKVRKRSLGLDNAKNHSELQGTGGIPGCQVPGPGVIVEMYN